VDPVGRKAFHIFSNYMLQKQNFIYFPGLAPVHLQGRNSHYTLITYQAVIVCKFDVKREYFAYKYVRTLQHNSTFFLFIHFHSQYSREINNKNSRELIQAR